MAIYQCDICSEITESATQPDICESCGTQNGPWTKTVDGLTRVTLSSGPNHFIIYADIDLTRNEFKQFFSDVTDADGDGIYKYCDPYKAMVRFTKNPEGVFEISAPEPVSNYFSHKDKKLDEEPVKIRGGDKISLFSVNQGKVIGEFDVS